MFTFWICLFVIFIAIEVATINLVSVWFSIGSLVSAWFSILTNDIKIQLLAFIITSIISFIIINPLLKRKHYKLQKLTTINKTVGKIGTVVKDIKQKEAGVVLIERKRFKAISEHEIKKGHKIKVLFITKGQLMVEEISLKKGKK